MAGGSGSDTENADAVIVEGMVAVLLDGGRDTVLQFADHVGGCLVKVTYKEMGIMAHDKVRDVVENVGVHEPVPPQPLSGLVVKVDVGDPEGAAVNFLYFSNDQTCIATLGAVVLAIKEGDRFNAWGEVD